MSERTILRRFAAATGVTPARWLLSERLSRARTLLEDTAHADRADCRDRRIWRGGDAAASLPPAIRHDARRVPGAVRDQCQLRLTLTAVRATIPHSGRAAG